jgi:Trp operon repressor
MHVSKTRRAKALTLRAAMYSYLLDNPATKPKQLKDKFDVSSATVTRHLSAIRNGWRPDGIEGEGSKNV